MHIDYVDREIIARVAELLIRGDKDVILKEMPPGSLLSWQLKTLLGQIQQIELHESGDCPCILNTEDPPERCLGKHLLNISTLSRETANMSSQNKEWLLKLAREANERHEQFKRFICHTEDLPKLTDWARNWRKQYIEPIYYTCEVKPPEETTLPDSPGGLDVATCKLPVEQSTPGGSCIREDLKNRSSVPM